ncbi:MAG: hypothetical protein ACSI46_06060 [Gloeotrichia echinulata DVL01]|jgi:hypothetical protein|nr:hypothetical protein [Gloeotrichia echinulata DEX184]
MLVHGITSASVNGYWAESSRLSPTTTRQSPTALPPESALAIAWTKALLHEAQSY